jgi:unsaturated rhamnogalacturonyl hydrolase
VRHYVWEERSHPGFYTFGKVFEKFGARLASLDVAPTAANLKGASVYIIVDPDHKKDNPNPNFVNDKDVKAISDWVKAGGTLFLMANDSSNCDLEHFNKLAGAFGITYLYKNLNMVKNDNFEQGLVQPSDTAIFKKPYRLYLKELSPVELKKPATAAVTKEGDIIIATARMGKGKVIAVGDPWLYNEYLDGRKLPALYQNYAGAEDLAKWLLK